MMIPPYISKADLYEDMTARPCGPFFVRPSDYRVVDGDTFALLSDGDGYRKTAFRVRLFSVNTPELPKKRGADAGLKAIGINPYSGSAGDQSKKHVLEICSERALFVEPCRNDAGGFTDQYGRLLGNVSISGSKGPHFDICGAFALEPYLVRTGYGVAMRDKQLPPDMSLTLWELDRSIKGLERKDPEGDLDCSL